MNKTVIIIYDKTNPRVDYLKKTLKDQYKIVKITNHALIKEKIDELFYDVSAVIIDNPSKKQYAKKLIRYIEDKNDYMLALPVIILSDEEHVKKDEKFLDGAAVSIIVKDTSKKIVLKRIEKSIRFVNSTSFEEFSKMLKSLPVLIYLKDKKGRYAFCSKYWHHLYDEDDKDWTIRGKTDLEIRKDKANAKKAMKTDLEVISSGEGRTYVIKEKEDTGSEYYQVIKEPIKNNNGDVKGIISLVTNVTEQELIRQELRKKSITDGLTGLFNRAYFDEYIAKHIVKNDIFPLGIIVGDCDGLKNINDELGHVTGDEYICLAAKMIEENLPEESRIFRMGGDEFISLLPQVSQKVLDEYVDSLEHKVSEYGLENLPLNISFGSYLMKDSQEDVGESLAKADHAMYEAKRRK